MLEFRTNWVCMDCECEFKGHVETDNEVILCKKCYKAFEKFVNEDESRSFSLYWWNEFIRTHGYRKDREERQRYQYIDAMLEELCA